MRWQIKQIDKEAGVVTLANQELNWDNFPAQATNLLHEWELMALKREYGADRHSWLLSFEGSQFRLEYEHYGGCWLEPVHPTDREVLLWLAWRHKD